MNSTTCPRCQREFPTAHDYQWHSQLPVSCVVPISTEEQYRQSIDKLKQTIISLNARIAELSAAPANVARNDKKQEWFKDGVLHRDDDLPAVIHSDGTQEWRQHGKLHRDGDKPAYVRADGTREWWQHGKFHREADSPAVIYSNGTREWYKNGNKHRDNALPAVFYADGSREWWIDGVFIGKSDK